MREAGDEQDGLLYASLDVILSDRPDATSIVQSDILYIGPDRMAQASRRGVEGGPTLAIEILSPSTRRIDPDARTLEAFELHGGRYTLAVAATGTEPVDLPPFTGLALVLDRLWPDQ